jgi:4-amino-4-deoxy-L-arabinose transferase-like glycosyltransferase
MEEEKKEEKVTKEEKEFEKKERKIELNVINWLKDPYHYSLVGILFIALIIRIYYFNITKNQAIWWDGLCYGAIARDIVTHQWTTTPIIMGENVIRPWLMSIVWAGLIKLGVSEIGSRIVMELIPSFLIVFVTYFIAEKMYSKRFALIATFIMAISWIDIFYSMRLLTHIPGLFLSMVSIYYFFKSLEKEKISFKYFTISIFLAFLSVLTRWTYGLVGIVYIIHLIFINKLKVAKQKQFWIGGIIGSIPMTIFFLYNLLTYGRLFPALANYAQSASEKTEIAWYTFGLFKHILGGVVRLGNPSSGPLITCPWFYLFIFGIIMMFAQLFLGYGLISKVKKLSSHVFILSLLILNTFFLAFYIKYSEDRYMFECFISIVFITAYAIDVIYLYIKKYNKLAAFGVVVLLLLLGGYCQYAYGSPITIDKASSFYQMKQAFLWIKDNTPANSAILGWAHEPYTIYYAERAPVRLDEINSSWSYLFPTQKATNFSKKFDYAVVHVFGSKTPQVYLDYLESIKSNLTVVHAEFLDAQQQQPGVIIYKYNR